MGWVVCYSDGLYRLDPATEQLQKVELPRPDARIYDITQDHDGTLWVAATGGIFRFSDGRWSFLHVPNEDGSDGVYSSLIAMPDGSIWASSFGKGLLQRRAAPTSSSASGSSREVLADASVYSVRIDLRGRLWANTDQGAVIFDGQNWLRFDVEDGLAGNDTEAFAFLPDTDGSVWIGTAARHDPHPRSGTPAASPGPDGSAHRQRPARRPRRWIIDTRARCPGARMRPWTCVSARTTTRARRRPSSATVCLACHPVGSARAAPSCTCPLSIGGHYKLQIMAVDAPHARKSARGDDVVRSAAALVAHAALSRSAWHSWPRAIGSCSSGATSSASCARDGSPSRRNSESAKLCSSERLATR